MGNVLYIFNQDELEKSKYKIKEFEEEFMKFENKKLKEQITQLQDELEKAKN